MPIDKPWILGPSGSFITQAAPAKGRSKVLRLIRTMLGPDYANPNFTFRLADEANLPFFLARRIEVTAAKFQYALAQSYAFRDTNPFLIVEGARAQHGQGNSTVRADGNRILYTGTEAAHYGIGTITHDRDALSIHSARRLISLAEAQDVARREVASSFEASGQLITLGMAQDASTYLAPAMINQVEGRMEGDKQRYLLGALSPFVPDDPTRLAVIMNATAFRVAELLMGRRAVLRPIEERLQELRHNPGARELWQDPNDPDFGNRLFGNRESQFLEIVHNLVGGSNSPLQEQVETIIRRIPERTEELVELATESRAELS